MQRKISKAVLLYRFTIKFPAFRDQSTLKAHTFTHTWGKQIEYKLCNNKFDDPEYLKRNQTIHTIDAKIDSKFICSQCLKMFLNFWHLKCHIITHSGDRQFKCGVCGMEFGHQHTLWRHLKKTLNEEKNILTKSMRTLLGKFPWYLMVQIC